MEESLVTNRLLALIPTVLKNIPIEKLKRGRFQPRISFPEERIQSMVNSISHLRTLIHPVVVRPLSADTYEIIAGEMRWRAFQRLRLPDISCSVGNFTDEEAASIALAENISRKELNPIEKAKSLNSFIEEFGYTEEEIGSNVGLKQSQVAHLLRLLKLDQRVQDLLFTEKLLEGHGKILAGLQTKFQYQLAKECLEKQWSMRKLESAIKELLEKGDIKKNKVKASDKEDANTKWLEEQVSLASGYKVEYCVNKNTKEGYVKVHFKGFNHLDVINKRLGYKPDSITRYEKGNGRID